jgi:glutaredoxin
MPWFSFPFLRRRRLPPVDLSHLHVVLYTRQACHLCEQTHRLLTEEQGRYAFTMECRDIDADPELVKQFGELVPVVSVNRKVRFRGGVNRVLLARLFRAEADRAATQESGRRRR